MEERDNYTESPLWNSTSFPCGDGGVEINVMKEFYTCQDVLVSKDAWNRLRENEAN